MKCIELSGGKVAIVDDEDFAYLAQWRWSSRSGYAKRTGYVSGNGTRGKPGSRGRCVCITMHREIMGNPAGKEIDHRNGNTFDNRKSNLRVCTHSQNATNRGATKKNLSGFKGVHWRPKDQKWIAQIMTNGKCIRIGGFDSAEEAASAYLTAALEYHGEFANLN